MQSVDILLEPVRAILYGMAGLGLDNDEVPVLRTARIERCRAVEQQLLDTGKA